jgi:hypothetical protein
VLHYPHPKLCGGIGPVSAGRKLRIRVLENSMRKKLISLVASVCFVGVALPGATRQVRAQAPSALYPAAAPLNQYFIPEKASEI